jgi:hypothetical protein
VKDSVLIGSATVPELVTVTALAALTAEMGWFPNASEVGARVNAVVAPVPVSATVLVPPPVVTTLKDAVFAPAVVGLNAMEITQEVPEATELPQELPSVNWLALVPASATEVMGSAAPPLLTSVTGSAALATLSA